MRKHSLIIPMVFIMTLGSLTIGSFNRTFACSCIQSTTEESYNNAEYVFRGKVTNVDYDGQEGKGSNTATFDVSEVFKGEVESEFDISSLQSSASCGVYFTEGEEWVIFAGFEDSEFDGLGEITTNLCRGNFQSGATDVSAQDSIDDALTDLKDLATENEVDGTPMENTSGSNSEESDANVALIGAGVIGVVALIIGALYIFNKEE